MQNKTFGLPQKQNYLGYSSSHTFESTCSPHVCLRVRHHVSRCQLAQCNAPISTNLKASLPPRNVSQHRGLYPYEHFVGVARYLVASLMPPQYFLVQFASPKHSKSTCCPHVCLRVRRNVSRLELTQCNFRSSINLKAPISPGIVSQHRPVFMRAIVGVAFVYFHQSILSARHYVIFRRVS